MALDAAVAAAKSLVDHEETLIVVTADHAHAFSFSGYQSRANPIFHAADKNMEALEFPYSSLLYANGPGARNRSLETNAEMSHVDYKLMAGIYMKDETRKWQQPGW